MQEKKRREFLYPWLQLVRLPNLFTSQSNVLAGLLTAGLPSQNSSVFLLLAATTCLYAGGVVLNDWFDETIDRIERPERPLPSGKIKKKHALYFVFFSLMAGMFFSLSVSLKSGIIASLLVLCIVAYDGLLKRFVVAGGVVMALCRALNWYLGLAEGSPPVHSLILVVPVFIFVLIIMSFSKYEAEEKINHQCWTISGLLFFIFSLFLVFIAMNSQGGIYGAYVAGIFCMVMFIKIIQIVVKSYSEIIARTIVGFLVVWFIPLDAIIVYFVRGWKDSLFVLVLLIPCWLSARFFYTT